MDLDIVQTIVQGGAVGLLLAFGFLGYKIATKIISVGTLLITNHLTDLTDEIASLRVEISLLSGRLLDILNRPQG